MSYKTPDLFFAIDAEGSKFCEQYHAARGLHYSFDPYTGEDKTLYGLSTAILDPVQYIPNMLNDGPQKFMDKMAALHREGKRQEGFEQQTSFEKAFRELMWYKDGANETSAYHHYFVFNMIVKAETLHYSKNINTIAKSVKSMELDSDAKFSKSNFNFKQFGKLQRPYKDYYESRTGQNMVSCVGLARHFSKSWAIRNQYDRKKPLGDDFDNIGSFFVFGAGQILQYSLVNYARQNQIPLITYNSAPMEYPHFSLTSHEDRPGEYRTRCPVMNLRSAASYFNLCQLSLFGRTGELLFDQQNAEKALELITQFREEDITCKLRNKDKKDIVRPENCFDKPALTA